MQLIQRLKQRFQGNDIQNHDEAVSEDPKFSVLFVCMGNICRSPTAAGTFKQLLVEHDLEALVRVDSAGTHAYHVGNAPDYRALEAAARRGIDLSSLRARRVAEEDFSAFDLVLAMDELNLELLREICPEPYRDRIKLFMEYAPQLERADVPDPYYGGASGFELVLDLVGEASRGLLNEILAKHRP